LIHSRPIKPFIAIVLASVVGACATTDKSTCEHYYLPPMGDWSTVQEVGESVTFANKAGDTLSLELVATQGKLPVSGADRFYTDEARCGQALTTLYTFNDRAAGLRLIRSPAKASQSSSKHQPFTLLIRPEAPLGTPLHYAYQLNEADLAGFSNEQPRSDIDSTRVTRVFSHVSIGNQRYADAIELASLDTSTIEAYVLGLCASVLPTVKYTHEMRRCCERLTHHCEADERSKQVLACSTFCGLTRFTEPIFDV